MRTRTVLCTILAAALFAGPGAAMAQDFDDDFDDDFDSDFDDDDDDDFDDDFGDDFDDAATDGDADATAATGGSSEARGIGIGAIVPLSAVVGGVDASPSVTYDMGDFHIDGFLSFATNDTTTFGLGARFLYHLFDHARSDFSVGGGLTFVNVSGDGLPESRTEFFAEVDAQIRMFLVPQVALTSTLGLVTAFGDADGTALGGQVLGGITYFID